MSSERFLDVISNLSKYHREHEKFYGQAPLKTAIEIQDASKTLKTLADRWINLERTESSQGNPYMGCTDLNEEAAIQHDGVLFMEGEGEPTEISQLKRKMKNIRRLRTGRNMAIKGHGEFLGSSHSTNQDSHT